MSKLAASKWLIAADLAFLIALAIEIRAKQYASTAMMSIAARTGGIPETVDSHALTLKSGVASTLGMIVALIGVACRVVSAFRAEPISWLVAIIPALAYSALLLMVV